MEDILHHLECKKLNPVNDGKKTTHLNWFSPQISEPSAVALHKSYVSINLLEQTNRTAK